MPITCRDVGVMLAGVAAAWSVSALAGDSGARDSGERLGPAVWEWTALEARPTDVGELRNVVRQPTATLDELEMHVTTLNPGLSSHPPHTHPNEELVIVREGEVEVLSGGEWKRLGPGSIVFNASNSPHALRNVGAGPATYHVINWTSAATLQTGGRELQ